MCHIHIVVPWENPFEKDHPELKQKINMSTVYYQKVLGLQDARLLLLRNVSECNLPASTQSKFSGRTLASKMDFIIYSNVENISGNSKRTIHTQTDIPKPKQQHTTPPKKHEVQENGVSNPIFEKSCLVLKIRKIRSESEIRKLLLRWEWHWPKIRLLDLGWSWQLRLDIRNNPNLRFFFPKNNSCHCLWNLFGQSVRSGIHVFHF